MTRAEIAIVIIIGVGLFVIAVLLPLPHFLGSESNQPDYWVEPSEANSNNLLEELPIICEGNGYLSDHDGKWVCIDPGPTLSTFTQDGFNCVRVNFEPWQCTKE